MTNSHLFEICVDFFFAHRSFAKALRGTGVEGFDKTDQIRPTGSINTRLLVRTYILGLYNLFILKNLFFRK